MELSKIVHPLAIKIRPYQLKVELVLISLIIIGLLLRNSEAGKVLLIISFNFLAILYFIMAFRLIPPENKTTVFLNQLIQLSFSVAMLGILFSVNHYAGAGMMLRMSTFAMFVGFVFSLITKFRNNETQKFLDGDTIRLIIVTLAIVSLITFGNYDVFSPQKNIDTQEIIQE